MSFLGMLEEESQVMLGAQESDTFTSGYNFYIIPSKMQMLDVSPSHSSCEKSAHQTSVLSLPDSVFPISTTSELKCDI